MQGKYNVFVDTIMLTTIQLGIEKNSAFFHFFPPSVKATDKNCWVQSPETFYHMEENI